jgi:hypothetical protein
VAVTDDEPTLAGRVESLSRQVEAVRAEVAGLATLASRVRTLADRVAELAAVRSGDGTAVAPVSWFDLDADRAASALVELTRWIRTVLSHYTVASRELTDCWHRHPAAVDGLLALRSSWQSAYHGPGARPESAVDWHIRQLPGLADLLREELRACSDGNHLPGGEVERARRTRLRVLPDDERIRAYAARWAADRALDGGAAPDAGTL